MGDCGFDSPAAVLPQSDSASFSGLRHPADAPGVGRRHAARMDHDEISDDLAARLLAVRPAHQRPIVADDAGGGPELGVEDSSNARSLDSQACASACHFDTSSDDACALIESVESPGGRSKALLGSGVGCGPGTTIGVG